MAEKDDKPQEELFKFEDIKEAVATAAYVEQLLSSEQQWIMNRLSWLFTSQSFLITAFVLIINSKNLSNAACLLLVGVPIVGFICCVTVGIAVIAAENEGKSLGDQRALLGRYIKNKTKVNIPQIGASEGFRDKKWTLTLGALPHRFLPWVFAGLWLGLFIVSK